MKSIAHAYKWNMSRKIEYIVIEKIDLIFDKL